MEQTLSPPSPLPPLLGAAVGAAPPPDEADAEPVALALALAAREEEEGAADALPTLESWASASGARRSRSGRNFMPTKREGVGSREGGAEGEVE